MYCGLSTHDCCCTDLLLGARDKEGRDRQSVVCEEVVGEVAVVLIALIATAGENILAASVV